MPGQWKQSEIVPIHKMKRPENEPGSYRPISLTSCVGKLVERMVVNRLRHLWESGGTLAPEQAGFRKARSTEEQLARVIANAVASVEDGRENVTLYVDFSRAFDSVPLNVLLLKMLDMGTPATYVKWMSSFLKDRTARVRCGGRLSKPRPFRRGVPQGTVAGPLAFVGFVMLVWVNWVPVGLVQLGSCWLEAKIK